MSDELIIALGRLAAEALETTSEFEGAASEFEGAPKAYLTTQSEQAWERYGALRNALCVIPASGIPGALVQLQAVAGLLDLAEVVGAKGLDEIREQALHSIYGVLRSACIGEYVPNLADHFARPRDPFLTDVAHYMTAMKAYFAENDIELEKSTRRPVSRTGPIGSSCRPLEQEAAAE